MAYADFTFEDLQQHFGLTAEARPLYAGVKPVAATPWLQETLRQGQGFAAASEKARCEFIVAPILLACRDLLGGSFVIYSGVRLDVDPEHGLKGECDFILARSSTVLVLQAPLMVILEAKKHDIEEGISQCAAQMIGVRMFNERHQTPTKPIFGCVTNGDAWQFMQLADNRLYLDSERYFINEVDKILGVLTSIMNPPPSQASDAA